MAAFLIRAEEQTDAPQSGQADQRINDPGQDGQLAAAEERYGVKAEQADTAPVQGADDGKRQRDLINHLAKPPFLDLRLACPQARRFMQFGDRGDFPAKRQARRSVARRTLCIEKQVWICYNEKSSKKRQRFMDDFSL